MIRKLLPIMTVLLHKPIDYNPNILPCKLHDFSCSRNGEINPESAAVAIFQISLAHPVNIANILLLYLNSVLKTGLGDLRITENHLSCA